MSNYLVTNKPIPIRANINKLRQTGDLKEMPPKSMVALPEVGFLTVPIFPKGRVLRPSNS
jgi:hypothetical protein